MQKVQNAHLVCPNCDRIFETEEEVSDHALECVPPFPVTGVGPGEIHDTPEVEEHELKMKK